MATYRIGDEGATVFDADGKPLARLRPGSVVVEGAIDTARLPAQDDPKRRKGYADKRQRVTEDKGIGLAIDRLDRASARIQEARRKISR